MRYFEKEVNITDIFNRVLLKWKRILLITLVFLVIGGFKQYYTEINKKNTVPSDADVNSYKLGNNIESYLNNKIEEFNKKFEASTNSDGIYVSQSIFTIQSEDLVDIQNNGSADIDETIKERSTILEILLSNKNNLVSIEKEMNLNAEEIYNCYVDIKKVENVVLVIAHHHEKNKAELITNTIINKYESSFKDFLNNNGYNTDVYLLETSVVSNYYDDIDEDIGRLERLLSWSDKITNLKSKMSSSTQGISIKEITKTAVAFGLIGAFVSVCYYALRTLLSDKLLSHYDVEQLDQLNCIIDVPLKQIENKKLNKIQYRLLNRDINNLDLNDDERFAIAKQKFDDIIKNNQKVAIVSNADTKTDELIIEKFNIKDTDIIMKNIDKNVESFKNVKDYKNAIVVMQKEASKYRDINNTINLLKENNINILGYMMF